MNIAVLASGGVDSSVAVHLLKEQGYEPTLFYIKIGMEDEHGYIDCPAEDDMTIVTWLGKHYGLKVEMVSLHEEYWDNVVAYTIEKVRQGLTPNPDMMCNKMIKFGYFDSKWGHEFDKIATGHYATTTEIDGRIYLSTSPDPVKDQTDFLCQITSEQLSILDFPIGLMQKREVRDIAERNGLAPAHRKDSQGICFLGNTTYNALLRHYLGERQGNIVEWETGRVLGQHQGYWFFTLGQRKGLRLGGGPWFVVKKDIDDNIVYVTRNIESPGLLCNASEFALSDWHEIRSGQGSSSLVPTLSSPPFACYFKIRHSPEFEEGTFGYSEQTGRYVVKCNRTLRGVAPGQFAVIYVPYSDGRNICLGSGEIMWKE